MSSTPNSLGVFFGSPEVIMSIPERKHKMKKIIKIYKSVNEKNLKYLKFNLGGLNVERNFDVLIFAIENDAPISFINYIIKTVPYKSLNFSIIDDRKLKSPFITVMTKNNFEMGKLIFNKNNFDINEEKYDVIKYFLEENLLTNKILKYILSKEYGIENINDSVLLDAVVSPHDFFEIIIKHYIFDQDFIINMLNTHYKHRTPLSDQQLKKIIIKEKSKIQYSSEYYTLAKINKRYKNLKILFEHDVYFSNQDIETIINYDLLKCAVALNDLNFVKVLLKYNIINYKYIFTEEVLKEASIHDNMEMLELLVKIYLDAFTLDSVNYKPIEKLLNYSSSLLNKFHPLRKRKHNDDDDDDDDENDNDDHDHTNDEKHRTKKLKIPTFGYSNKLLKNYKLKRKIKGSTDNIYEKNNKFNSKNISRGGSNISNENVNGNNNQLDYADNIKPNEISRRKRYGTRYVIYLINMAIRIGSLKMVKYLVETEEYKPFALNIKDIKGDYPIVTALQSENVEIFEYILNNEGFCDKKKLRGNTLLNLAIKNKNDKKNNDRFEYIELILKYLDNPLEIDNFGCHPLFLAIHLNELEAVKSIIINCLKKNINITIQDSDGNTPLILAYRLGHREIFEFLLKMVDINCEDISGNTILFYVIRSNDIPVVKYLLKREIDIAHRNKLNQTPLEWAIANRKKEIILLLIKQNNSYTILNQLDSQGETFLNSAIKTDLLEGKLNILECMLKHGSDPNLCNTTENYPSLVYAVQQQSYLLVRLLVRYGANTTYIVKDNESLLNKAIQLGDEKVVRELTKCNSNFEYLSHYHRNLGYPTPWETAIRLRNTKILEYFITQFSEILEAEDIIPCIKHGDLKTLNLLISKSRLNIDIKTKKGYTLLAHAIMNKQTEIVEYLIERGASVYSVSNDGQSIMDLCRFYLDEQDRKKIEKKYLCSF